ncbi:MAG: acyl-CoA dehydrogenase family protein [Actinomycetota bacterium]
MTGGIDYADSPEEAQFRASFRTWVQEHHPGTPPPAADTAAQHEFRRDWHKAMHAGGWLGLSWPLEYGGRAMSPIYEAIINDELGRAELPNAVGPLNWLGRALLLYGTDEQREEYLAPMLKGDTQWCQGFSEPGAGSDLAGLSTHGDLDGDRYLVTGQKLWTSGAQFADYCLVLTRTNRDLPKHQGISMLIADMTAPGITVQPVAQSWGGDRFCEVFFDETPVPVENRLGDEGDGWGMAGAVLAYERGPSEIGIVATWQRKLAELAAGLDDDAEKTVDYGRSLVAVEACRVHLLEGLSRRAEGEDPGPASSVDKLLMVRAEQTLGTSEFDARAAGAVTGEDSAAANDYVYSRAASIYGGTEQIQKGIIATRILGLPR